MQSERGQSLIAVITLITVALLIITATLTLTVVTRRSITFQNRAEQAKQLAESGIENAYLQLLRNHNYTGETYTYTTYPVTITVTTNGASRTITSQATVGDSIRTYQATGTFANTLFTLTSWREVP